MRKIWLDCDPGIDDSITMCLAKANKDLEVVGISTIAGNQTSDRVTENARRMAGLLGFDCPVIRGVRGPLIQKMAVADYVHGTSGLGDCVLPETDKTVLEGHPIELMYQEMMKIEGKFTFILTGPLTNGALLFKSYPDILDKFDEVIIMGGGSTIGNKAPMTEFNIYTDPEAAKIVFNTPIKITLVSLDVTNYCGVTQAMVDSLNNSSSIIQNACGQMLRYYSRYSQTVHEGTFNIHDASTLVYLTNPDVFTYIMVTCDIDTNQGINRGMTVCDKRLLRNLDECNVKLLNSVNAEAWRNTVFSLLSTL